MPCIRGKDRNIKVSLKDKMEVWKKYEKKLLNEENERYRQWNVEKMKDLVKKCIKAVVASTKSHESRKSGRTRWRNI